MQYSEDPEQIRQWVPLMMEGRDPQQKIAATWTPIGTDVNFGQPKDIDHWAKSMATRTLISSPDGRRV